MGADMTRTRRTFVVAAALAGLGLAAAPAGAQGIGGELPSPDRPPTRQGTRGATFLDIGIGARANAMAGAAVTSVVGPTALYWNIAGLAGVEAFSAHATRQLLYDDFDISQNYFGAALPFFGGVVGASVNTLSSGDLQRATEDDPFGDNTVGQTFEWTSTAIGLGYSRRLTDRLDVGAQAKFVFEGMSDAQTSWAAVDFGTMFRTGIYGLNVAAALQNIGPSARASGQGVRRVIDDDDFFNRSVPINFATRDTDLPTTLRFSVGGDVYGHAQSMFGAGSGQHTVMGELAFSDGVGTALQTAVGAEYGFRNFAFIRAGKRWYNDERDAGSGGGYGFSGGVGVRLPLAGRALRFDYSYTEMGLLQNVQVFSFELGR